MQSMPGVLGRWHSLLHVRALLTRWYDREQEVPQVHSWPLFDSQLLTCGDFLRDDTTENKKYIKSVLDLFSIPNFYIRKGRPHGHRYGKKEGDREYHTANQLQKKCRKRGYSNIHDRFIRDTWFRKTMLELDRTEEVIREMDKLANEDHTHIATEEELDVHRGNWWIRSNFVGSDTMPTRHRPDFKQALSTLHRLKKSEDEAYYQNWWQSSSSSWWQRQDSWWHPSPETSPRRWTWHWSNGETCENQWIVTCGMSLTMNLVQNYSDHFGNSQRSLLSPTGCVKSTSLTTENWLRKLYLQHEQQHERWGQAWHKLHQQQVHEHLHAQVAQLVSKHLERAVSLHLLMSVSHAPHGSRCSWVFVPSACHPCAFLSDLTFLPFYFDLSFPVFFHFSFLMHPEQHTELDNLITMQHNLRTSAKWSNDAYDVHTSLTPAYLMTKGYPSAGNDALRHLQRTGKLVWDEETIRQSARLGRTKAVSRRQLETNGKTLHGTWALSLLYSSRDNTSLAVSVMKNCGSTRLKRTMTHYSSGVPAASANCLWIVFFAGRNNNNFDLCRPPGN